MRPPFIVHWRDILADDTATYPGSDELLSIGAPIGKAVGLKRIGVHHEILPPGRRTSYPHAESDEEEFAYVLSGHPDVWIDGELHRLGPGDAVGFPAGTGIAHTFLNNTAEPAEILVLGQANLASNKIFYPKNPELSEVLGDRRWADPPSRPLGEHSGLPSRPGFRARPLSLKTERLLLRPHEDADAEGIFAMRTHPDGARFLASLPPDSIEEVRARFKVVRGRALREELFSLSIEHAGRFAGLIALTRLDRSVRKGELAFELSPALWGQGLMREAVSALTEHAFEVLGLNRLEIRTDPRNLRCQKLSRALGFREEGHLRQDERHPDGRFLDTMIFGLLREDFRPGRTVTAPAAESATESA